MKRWFVLGIVALCAALVVASASGASISTDPDAPVALTSDQEFDLAFGGSTGGAFAYYGIIHPGNEQVVTIEMDLAPGDAVAQSAAGFNVYGPNGVLVGAGTRTGDKYDRKSFSWEQWESSACLIQVYNYLDGGVVSFHIKVSGLASAASATAAVAAEAAPAKVSTGMAVSNLVGSGGGAFHYFQYPSDGSDAAVVLHLYYAPDDQWVSNGFGVLVWAPDGSLAAAGRHDVSFTAEQAGTYTLQVYNYIADFNVNYTLSRD